MMAWTMGSRGEVPELATGVWIPGIFRYIVGLVVGARKKRDTTQSL